MFARFTPEICFWALSGGGIVRPLVRAWVGRSIRVRVF
jgi:hypothetical protein